MRGHGRVRGAGPAGAFADEARPVFSAPCAAPIVGRTAAQCMERYDKLLEMATGGKDEDYDPTEDPRRLRPGEIDPNPESKPARPDPVDMDEDEKEMLSEARARLANTRGKKAKRKARERQLEEAKRMAVLQKRRELRAAGFRGEYRLLKRPKNKRLIDHAKEIPFQKVAPAGVFDTEEERLRGESEPFNFKAKLAHDMDEKQRAEEEKKLRKQDKAKFRRFQDAKLPTALAKVSKANDPSTARKRSRLEMPAPLVTDQELEEVAKTGSSQADEEEDGSHTHAATRALMGSYDATPGATPLQELQQRKRQATAARTPASRDAVMEEARNLAQLTSLQTPLQGGDNPELESGTGFAGATPQGGASRTPNLLAGPSGSGAAVGGSGATPLRTPGATPLGGAGGRGGGGATPQRGNGHAGDNGFMAPPPAPGGGALTLTGGRAARQLEKARRAAIRDGLSSLPEPQYTYDLEVPDAPEGEQEGTMAAGTGAGSASWVEDAAEVEARREAERERQRQRELARRSTVLKRGLPRPVAVNESDLPAGVDLDSSEGEFDRVRDPQALIQAEMVRLLRHDAVTHPVKRSSRKRQRQDQAPPHLPAVEDEHVAEAREMVATEAAEAIAAAGGLDALAHSAAWDDPGREVLFCPPRNAFCLASDLSPQEKVAALQHRHEALRGVMGKQAQRAAKHEQKAAVLTQGLEKRSASLAQSLTGAAEQIPLARAEHACFSMLARQESAALPARMDKLRKELAQQRDIERTLQSRYESLLAERDGAYSRLTAKGVDAASALA